MLKSAVTKKVNLLTRIHAISQVGSWHPTWMAFPASQPGNTVPSFKTQLKCTFSGKCPWLPRVRVPLPSLAPTQSPGPYLALISMHWNASIYVSVTLSRPWGSQGRNCFVWSFVFPQLHPGFCVSMVRAPYMSDKWLNSSSFWGRWGCI